MIESVMRLTGVKMWSCRFSPTGRSAITSIWNKVLHIDFKLAIREIDRVWITQTKYGIVLIHKGYLNNIEFIISNVKM